MRTWLVAIVLAVASWAPSSGVAQWYASVDFVPLMRWDSPDVVFQRNETLPVTTTTTTGGVTTTTITPSLVGSTTVLASRDTELDFVSAGRITVGTRFGESVFGIEGSYMLTEMAESQASAQSAAGLLVSPFTPIGNTPDPSLDNNVTVRIARRSKMQSAELNFTQLVYSEQDGDATFLVGLRAMQIDDSLEYVSVNGVRANDFATSLENRLIGPQVGVRGRAPAPGGFVGLKLTGALLANAISETVVVNSPHGQINDGKGSLVGELGVDYWYSPTPNLSVRIGYQLLGLTGIGLATENLVSSANVSSVNTRGVLYHGPCVGLALNY